MNLLKTSPVVVIDDQSEEALPIIQVLGRLGVGCVYIPGDKEEELPKPPIAGVRLVFMDMQLGTEGGSRQVGTQAANVFCRSIDAGGVPIVIVLWTKHEEHVEEFKKALFGIEPRFRAGTIVARLDKPQKPEEINVGVVTTGISSLVDQHSPLGFLWAWEQLAYNAATETSNALGGLVAQRAGEQSDKTYKESLSAWLDSMRHVLRCLVQVACGQNVDSSKAYRDVLGVFAELHRDRLEHLVIGAASGDLPRDLEMEGEGPSPEEKTAINTMLLVAPVHEDDNAIRPGNLYAAQQELGKSCLHVVCRVNADEIHRELLQPPLDKDYKALVERLKDYRDRNELVVNISDVEKKLNARFREVYAECKPVLLEISPACDYAQRNRKVARFVGGLLVPEKLCKRIEKKGSILRIEPVGLPGIGGVWCPVFSGRFPYTLPDPERLVGSKPICRLRTPVLVAILNWCAAHASRPGYLSLG